LEGLVASIPNKGVIVQGLTAQDFEDIYTIRTMLESLAARRAVNKISDSELKELEHIIDLTDLYTSKHNVEKWLDVDTQFHEIIFKAAKSKPLWNILSSFHQFSIMPRRFSLQSHGRLKVSLAEHREIFESLKAKDPERVEKAIINHIKNAEKNMRLMLSSSFKDNPS
jgi:DNA-binding GntR family transcriptional regulator